MVVRIKPLDNKPLLSYKAGKGFVLWRMDMNRLLSHIWPWSKIKEIEKELFQWKVDYEELRREKQSIYTNYTAVARESELADHIIPQLEEKIIEGLTPMLSEKAVYALQSAFFNNSKKQPHTLKVAYNQECNMLKYHLIIPELHHEFFVYSDGGLR